MTFREKIDKILEIKKIRCSSSGSLSVIDCFVSFITFQNQFVYINALLDNNHQGLDFILSNVHKKRGFWGFVIFFFNVKVAKNITELSLL